MSDKLDLSPAVLDLVLYAGDGTTFEIDFVDENEATIDMSGFTWAAQIRKKRGVDPAFDLEFTTTNTVGGVLLVHVPAEITAQLPKSGQWDLQATAAGQDPITLLQGAVTCNVDVTRPVVPSP